MHAQFLTVWSAIFALACHSVNTTWRDEVH